MTIAPHGRGYKPTPNESKADYVSRQYRMAQTCVPLTYAIYSGGKPMELVPYRIPKPVRSSAARRYNSPTGHQLCANSEPDCSCGSTSGGGLPSGTKEEHSCRVFYKANGGIVFARPPHYGALFTDKNARDLYLLERGYLVEYTRNRCGFVSSRAYRKHTGKVAIDMGHWNMFHARRQRV